MPTLTTTAPLPGPPPNGTWKRDLPVWAVLAMDRREPDWRSRYHSVSTTFAAHSVLGVWLVDQLHYAAPIIVRKEG